MKLETEVLIKENMQCCDAGLATQVLDCKEMGRGVSSGGGQSSLGYLFGSGEAPNNAQAANSQGQPANAVKTPNATVASPPVDKQIPAGIPGNLKNNYHRADGQNCGNFLTDRPSTKVHAAPGGGSSLDYLFGGPPPGNNSSS